MKTSRRMTILEDRENASIKTPMVAWQGNDILVVTDLEKVLYDDTVDQATSHSQTGISTSGNNCPFCFTGVHYSWETSPQHLWTLSSLSPISPVTVVSQCITEKQRYSCMLKIVTELPWVSFSIFSLLRGCFTLLPFFCSLPHYVLLMELTYR